MFHVPHTETSCWCCKECDKHQINERHKYIIPCNERNECSKFLEQVATQRQANEAYKRESNQFSVSRHYKRKR